MKPFLNMADPGVIAGQTNIAVSSGFVLKYILTFILIIEIDHTRHLWQLGSLSGPHFGKHLFFGGLTFATQIKSMESSRDMTFT